MARTTGQGVIISPSKKKKVAAAPALEFPVVIDPVPTQLLLSDGLERLQYLRPDDITSDGQSPVTVEPLAFREIEILHQPKEPLPRGVQPFTYKEVNPPKQS